MHTQTAAALTTTDVASGLRIVQANRAFAAMLGSTTEDLVAQRLDLTGPCRDADKAEQILRGVRAGCAATGEFVLSCAGGGDIRIETEIAPVFDDAGDVEYLLVIARDITERRMTEDDLHRAKELLELATDAGGVGIWEWEPSTGRVRWNPTLNRLAGIDEDEPPSLERWLSVVHPDDLGIALDAADERYAGGEVTYRIIRPDGEMRHVVVRATEHLSAADGMPQVVGMVLDVTELRNAAAQVVDTLESITDAYFALDRTWSFTYVNQHFERLLVKEREAILGRNLWEVFPAAVDTEFERSYRMAMDDGEVVSFEELYTPLDVWFEVRAYPTPTGINVYFRDITERRAAEAERERLLLAEQAARREAEHARAAVEHQATYDSLTDLVNRAELMRRLDLALAAGVPVSVLFIDLDRFKLVNDSLGHAAGDEMLKTIGRRLAGLCDRGHIVSRIGGDEFVVGLVDVGPRTADTVAESILATIREPVEIDGHVLSATATIGICESAPATESADLLRDADVALYRAKDAGRDQTMRFDARARLELLERFQMERDLRDALSGSALALHYQPAFDLRTGEMTDVEALLRWTDPTRGPISPASFIPIAEESGLILPLGEWVLGTAAADRRRWGAHADFTAWTNVSGRQLARPGLADALARHLDVAGVAPSTFGIEITESILGDPGNALRELHQISELGVKIAIDDFGTGYSSISRLRELPVDTLKIDRTFIAEISAPSGLETVAAIVELGHALGTTIIAEGVETAEQLAAIRTTGCDKVAGWLLAPAVRRDALIATAAQGASVLRTHAQRAIRQASGAPCPGRSLTGVAPREPSR